MSLQTFLFALQYQNNNKKLISCCHLYTDKEKILISSQIINNLPGYLIYR
ncbi:MAG: hypothetical protein WCG25_01865 [bacterium]